MPVQRGLAGKYIQDVNVVAGSISFSGSVAAGAQYLIGTTGVSTGTGTIFIGVNVNTAVAAKMASDGTLFITGTVSGGAGGIQYVQDTTAQANTATGTIFLGIQGTTVRGFRLSATGDPGVTQVGNWNIATVSTLLGVIAVSGTMTVGTGTMSISNAPIQYVQDTTTIANTGSGFLVIGVQATTARALALSVTGDPGARQVGTWNVATVSTVLGALAISGTQTIVFGATQPISGSVSVINTPTVTVSTQLGTAVITGSVTPIGTLAIYETNIGTAWNSGLVTITTSAAGMAGILKVSAANTPYVTDLFISVDVPMNVQLRSATTAMAQLYFATKGGMAYQFKTAMICTSAQSFTFIPSLSGSCSVWAAGYTVT